MRRSASSISFASASHVRYARVNVQVLGDDRRARVKPSAARPLITMSDGCRMISMSAA